MARFHHPMRYLPKRVRAFRYHLRYHLRDWARSPPGWAQPDTPL